MKKTSFFDLDDLNFGLRSVSFRTSITGRYPLLKKRDSCELVYKLSGSSKQIFPDRTLDLVPDSIYFVPIGSNNSVTVLDPGDIIHIEFTSLGEIDLAAFPPEILCFPAGNQYKKLFLSAEEIWRKKSSGYYLRTHALICEILAGIVAERERHYMQSSKYSLIIPALDYIRENFNEKISVSGLAKLCGISDEYLRVLFKSFTGRSPLAYINNLRLENAREMLRGGFLTVAEVAEANGFESPGYFSRLFKKHYNIPPGRVCCTEPYLPSIFNENNE